MLNRHVSIFALALLFAASGDAFGMAYVRSATSWCARWATMVSTACSGVSASVTATRGTGRSRLQSIYNLGMGGCIRSIARWCTASRLFRPALVESDSFYGWRQPFCWNPPLPAKFFGHAYQMFRPARMPVDTVGWGEREIDPDQTVCVPMIDYLTLLMARPLPIDTTEKFATQYGEEYFKNFTQVPWVGASVSGQRPVQVATRAGKAQLVTQFLAGMRRHCPEDLRTTLFEKSHKELTLRELAQLVQPVDERQKVGYLSDDYRISGSQVSCRISLDAHLEIKGDKIGLKCFSWGTTTRMYGLKPVVCVQNTLYCLQPETARMVCWLDCDRRQTRDIQYSSDGDWEKRQKISLAPFIFPQAK